MGEAPNDPAWTVKRTTLPLDGGKFHAQLCTRADHRHTHSGGLSLYTSASPGEGAHRSWYRPGNASSIPRAAARRGSAGVGSQPIITAAKRPDLLLVG
jgi:hypothetical protein